MSLFWSAVLWTADMSGGTVFSAFSSGKKKVTTNQWDSNTHRMCEAWSRSLSVLWCCLFFSFLKNVGRREAPSATQSDCYLTLGRFPHKRGGKFSKGTKCLTLDDEPPGGWLTSAPDIRPDICDDFKTFTQREERRSKVCNAASLRPTQPNQAEAVFRQTQWKMYQPH